MQLLKLNVHCRRVKLQKKKACLCAEFKFNRSEVKKNVADTLSGEQGCQIFLDTIYQNGEKHTE
jgi:hypothetical protein